MNKLLRSNNTASSLQKSYDESHLLCSTAIYFECQNNDDEAIRAWDTAAERIAYLNSHRIPSNYHPKTPNERHVYETLIRLEKECRERIGLIQSVLRSHDAAALYRPGHHPHPPRPPLSSLLPPFRFYPPNISGGAHSHNHSSPMGQPLPSAFYNHSPAASRTPHSGKAPPRLTDPPLPPRHPHGHGPISSSTSGYPSHSHPHSHPHSPGHAIFREGGISTPMNHNDFARPDLPPPSQSPAPPGSKRSSRDYQRLNGAKGPSMRGSRVAPPENGLYYNDSKPLMTTLRTNNDSRRNPRPHNGTSSQNSNRSSRPAAASRAAGLAWNSISSKLVGSSQRHSNVPELTKPRSNERRESNELKHLSADYARHARAPFLSEVNAANNANGTGHDRSKVSAATDAAVLASTRRRSPAGGGGGGGGGGAAAAASRYRRSKTPEPLIDFTSSTAASPRNSVHRLADSYASPQSTISDSQQQQQKSQSPAGDVHFNKVSQPSPIKQRNVVRKPVKPQHLQGWLPSPSPSRESVGPTHSQTSVVPAANKAARVASASDEDVMQTTPDTTRKAEIPAEDSLASDFKKKSEEVLKNLPPGIDPAAAKQILNDIVIHGDEVHWDDVAGLETAKLALKEAVVYPFLRPDLFSGLREPARGMLLFGPPGTGKTMLARAVATESHSTFFSVGASSLTSKWHGESEKLVKALFGLAKLFAPSIIFVDEIDAILSSRASQGEHEVSRRTKTEFLVQWSDLQKAAAGREPSESTVGDASRVLVLAATNIPWDIDEAARRRFVRRQYIPLPESQVRKLQLERLLGHQNHNINEEQLEQLVELTEGFSGSDITALAKDAAMGPLRHLGEALLHTPMDQIRPISFEDFEASLLSIRPSVSQSGLQAYEDWAKEFGERGG
ncbi:hypothetical protein KEM54_004954 [Ascosphaera aggregata]|nr:hypothetical protein KEM54_004954 [Ascosphaera aggregata]